MRLNKLLFKRWQREENATAFVEAALIFPIMIVMMFGLVDIGNGLLINKKLVSASQVVSDLLARYDVVSDQNVDDAIAAARLVMAPFPDASFGVDIVGIRFVGGAANPNAEWRDTVNMLENGDVLINSDGLGSENEGVIAVTVEYTYIPTFSNLFVGNFEMQEVAYVRGRNVPFVQREP